MAILHTLLHRRRPWLILATIGLACVVGLVIYGSRTAAPPTPEQLCRERLGRQAADSVAGAALLLTCINDVTHSRSSPPRTPGR
jgi:hypothetical protein